MTRKYHNPKSEAAAKKALDLWEFGEWHIHFNKHRKDVEFICYGPKGFGGRQNTICSISLKEFIAKRQPLKGITKQVLKVVKASRKRK